MAIMLRFGSKAPADSVTPQSAALAEICALSKCCPSQGVRVPAELFEAAEAEMTEIMRQRGYSDIGRAQMIAERNFLLFGVPVICGD